MTKKVSQTIAAPSIPNTPRVSFSRGIASSANHLTHNLKKSIAPRSVDLVFILKYRR